MRVITEDISEKLCFLGEYPILGCFTGAVRILGGVVQVVMNIALSIFMAIPFLFDLVDERRKLSITDSIMNDGCNGFTQIMMGCFEPIIFLIP